MSMLIATPQLRAEEVAATPPGNEASSTGEQLGTMPSSVSAVFRQIERVNAAGIQAGDATVDKVEPQSPQFKQGKAQLSLSPIVQQARKASRKAATLATGEYFSRDSSYYDNDNYSHMALVIADGSAKMINVYSYGDTIDVNYNVSTGAFSIPAQKLYHFDTYGDVYACPVSFSSGAVTYSTTGSISGTVADDGTITLQPWGIFVISGDYTGSVVNAFYMSAWHPKNATIKTYNAKHVLTSYSAYVEQNADNEIRVYNFSNTGNVTGNGYVGGIASSVSGGNTLEYCENTGNVETVRSSSSAIYTGGIAAYVSGTATNPAYARYLLNKAPVTSQGSYVGGVIGNFSNAEATGLYNAGKVTATHYGTGSSARYATYVGGVVGMFAGQGNVMWNIADVTAEGYAVGGIAGQGNGTVSQCFNAGNMHADGQGKSSLASAGGIWGVGRPSINGCYNLGTVNGPDKIAGIIVELANTGSITNCYNAGVLAPTATGASIVKSIAYQSGATATCSGNAYLSDINEAYPDTAHGIPVTIDQLMAGEGLADLYVINRAAYPVPDSLIGEPIARYYAASLAFAPGDSAMGVTQNFYVGALDSVAWTSSDNISIDATGTATAQVGNGWVKKSISWNGIDLERQYAINVLETTGINGINTNGSDNAIDKRIYSIDGRYMGTDASVLPSGIYIQGGKKHIK